jgi:hypothetical protein
MLEASRVSDQTDERRGKCENPRPSKKNACCAACLFVARLADKVACRSSRTGFSFLRNGSAGGVRNVSDPCAYVGYSLASAVVPV